MEPAPKPRGNLRASALRCYTVRLMRLAFIAVGCLALMSIALLAIFPTVSIAFEGGFSAREVLSERSPDGSLRVVVTKRVAFPVYDWVDPSVVVRAELSEQSTDKIVASARIVLTEDSDFSPAAVEWYPGEAWVTGFDRRRSQALILRYRLMPLCRNQGPLSACALRHRK